jgi:hypothetical protein
LGGDGSERRGMPSCWMSSYPSSPPPPPPLFTLCDPKEKEKICRIKQTDRKPPSRTKQQRIKTPSSHEHHSQVRSLPIPLIMHASNKKTTMERFINHHLYFGGVEPIMVDTVWPWLGVCLADNGGADCLLDRRASFFLRAPRRARMLATTMKIR